MDNFLHNLFGGGRGGGNGGDGGGRGNGNGGGGGGRGRGGNGYPGAAYAAGESARKGAWAVDGVHVQIDRQDQVAR